MESDKNKIFNQVCEIITSEEFSDGQMDFHVKNCQIFSEEEENKHSYMDVFEAYVKLVDTAIDANLKQLYKEAEIDEFYSTFKARYAEYKEINYDAVEILKNAIDFENFKATMLRFKKGVINEEKDPSKGNLGEAGIDKFWRVYNEGTEKPWRKTIDVTR